MKPVDVIIGGVKFAHLDNLDSVEVSLDDLLVLVKEIELQRMHVESARVDKLHAIAKLNLIELEKPIRLDYYC